MIYRCHHAQARRRQVRMPGSLLESTGGSIFPSAEAVFRWFAPYRVRAVDLGRFDGAPRSSRKRTFQKGRNTMSKKTKKVEKIEQEKKEVKPAELSEQDLDKVAGGAVISTSKSNIRVSKF
jgi:hypothetical protein